MVFSKIVIMKLNKSLNCFLHWTQLDESHFAVFSESKKKSVKLNCSLTILTFQRLYESQYGLVVKHARLEYEKT